MKSRSIFCILHFLCFWSSVSHAEYVYRADSRPYSVIQKSKGFLPKGLPNFGLVAPDLSLWNHVNGDKGTHFSKDTDGYVSTTADPDLAEFWINNYLNGTGYIYRIHTTPNMIDCEATLGHHNPFSYEQEFAALGGIKDNQIVGWTPVVEDEVGIEKLNPFYKSEIYSNMGHGGAQPSLAAFPPDHTAWDEEPWARFRRCSRLPGRSGLSAGQSCFLVQSNRQAGEKYMDYVKAVCPHC
ncbi:Cholera enterotoxin subunit A [Colletotrichum spinosum]|uniref:Cholera enterotoxin subunit A n=1 Tax=Colletotrichum spinosum TaxID=1347390 RepID=A0A4V3HSA7_9PEZI|nr:Cholera enterotoxin subunit A [Colletotrichum spinosum]